MYQNIINSVRIIRCQPISMNCIISSSLVNTLIDSDVFLDRKVFVDVSGLRVCVLKFGLLIYLVCGQIGVRELSESYNFHFPLFELCKIRLQGGESCRVRNDGNLIQEVISLIRLFIHDPFVLLSKNRISNHVSEMTRSFAYE